MNQRDSATPSQVWESPTHYMVRMSGDSAYAQRKHPITASEDPLGNHELVIIALCRLALRSERFTRNDVLEALKDIADGPQPIEDYKYGIRCGLEDRDLQGGDPYTAAEYGYEQGLDWCADIAIRALKNAAPVPAQIAGGVPVSGPESVSRTTDFRGRRTDNSTNEPAPVCVGVTLDAEETKAVIRLLNYHPSFEANALAFQIQCKVDPSRSGAERDSRG